MIVKKYQGSTKEEAIALAKEELGEAIVITSTKERKPDGVLGLFKKSIFEVTVAKEDEPDVFPATKPTLVTPAQPRFSVVADEKIDLPPIKDTVKKPAKSEQESLDEETLRSTFKEITEVIEKNPQPTLSTVKSGDSPIIKKEFVKRKDNRDSAEPKKDEDTKPPVYETDEEEQGTSRHKRTPGTNIKFRRKLYEQLLDSDIEEKYINALLNDMGSILSDTNSIEYMMSNVYQKLILKLGKPFTIQLEEKGPKVVFLVGPTGVGKTTTIAKIAADFQLNKKKSVALIASDSYRLRAAEQLGEYANIMDIPMIEVLQPEEINSAIEKVHDYDLILVDTMGFSHKNFDHKAETKKLIDSVDAKYKKDIFLVLSVTTKFRDLKEIADTYKSICDYRMLFTKLDETATLGNILNLKLHTGADLSYVTYGQNVPQDIDVLDSQRIVKQFLGGA